MDKQAPSPGVLFLCARRDQRRVASIARRLADRGLPSSVTTVLIERQMLSEVERKLETARCVVVVWPASEAAERDTLIELADRAKARGALVTGTSDPNAVPLGFTDDPLIFWPGARVGSAAIDALLDACSAKLKLSQPPRKRRIWLRWGAALTSVMSVGVAITGFDLLNVQDQFCGIPNLQPNISDFCGAVGMGDRPTKKERVAWEQRDKRSCPALQQHIRDFPDGKFYASANALLSTRRTVLTGKPVLATHELPLTIGADGEFGRGTEQSRKRALARGERQAERLCDLYAHEQSGSAKRAEPVVDRWDCSGGACGFEGRMRCTIEVRGTEDICSTS